MNKNLFEELKWRGLVDQITSKEVINLLNKDKIVFYVGFDPTAISLHVGQLVVFNIIKLLKENGHQPIALMGSATGMIGDPSGKSIERQLLSTTKINSNIQELQEQIVNLSKKISGPDTIVVNNYDWIGKKSILEFLRDIGKNFSISQMITRDSVASRLNRTGGGITFTEFSYMLLQAYDFLHLNTEYNCVLQLGGSDQWGNIVSGIDLIRRVESKNAYGVTVPLLTKSDGSKFGKSESGTIWLNEKLTSAYKFYQFFLRQSDTDSIVFLKKLTNLSKIIIDKAIIQIKDNPEKRIAQNLLADYLTEFIHGKDKLYKCKKASNAIYGGDLKIIPETTIEEIFEDVPSIIIDSNKLKQGFDPIDLLLETGAISSRRAARQLINDGGFYINNTMDKSFSPITGKHLLSNNLIVIRTGKKNYYLIKQKV